jgi:GAF domain-containing protein
MSARPDDAAIAELERVISGGGVHAALRFLNARAPHRFTGIYRCDPPVLRNVQLFDRENPALEVGDDVPLRETYCSITSASAAPFSTPDAAADERLEGHPARESTLSYCGVPLLDPSGESLGTLCHFDVVPHPIPHAEIPLLQAAAPIVLQTLRDAGAFTA